MNNSNSGTRLKHSLLSLLVFLILAAAVPCSAGTTYLRTLSGKYVGGVPGRYKTAEEYKSANQRSNWRMVYDCGTGNGALWRSCKPSASAAGKNADKKAKSAGIRYVINLAESPEELKERLSEKDYADSYYKKLWKEGLVTAIHMEKTTRSYTTKSAMKTNRTQVIQAMRAIANNKGPYLVHCEMGKDRTGYFCILCEALCGSTYGNILRDYRQTYVNYCADVSNHDINAFAKKNLDYLLQVFTYEPTGSKWSTMNLKFKARLFLYHGGMSIPEIDRAAKNLRKDYR